MGNITQDGNAPMNTLKPQPGQSNSYNPKFHPLPGEWAKEQLESSAYQKSGSRGQRDSSDQWAKEQLWGLSSTRAYGTKERSTNHQTEIQRALASERAQHEYWEEWQGINPGKAVYENPRELQNTLLPSAKYGTEGRGYG